MVCPKANENHSIAITNVKALRPVELEKRKEARGEAGADFCVLQRGLWQMM